MPHALTHERPFDSFPSLLKQDFPLLHRPTLSAYSGDLSRHVVPSINKPLTPPSEMSGYNGAVSAARHTSQAYHLPGGSAAGTSHSRMGPQIYNNPHQNLFGTSSYSSRSYSQPTSPKSRQQDRDTMGESSQRRRGSMAVTPSLQIPSTINTPQTNIAELAVQITCLFWFEADDTLKRILENPQQIFPLVKDATPTTGFRKWVTTILSTTQVSSNVILLALLFIYRLKKLNPQVRGKPGSEYRLLTVALMLGNKFLDDNTYTNKTWAEVSGISVQEVHVMEVEFLSNMKYNLFTSLEHWKDWHRELGIFGTYLEEAQRQAEYLARQAYSTPVVQMPPNLPSPPASQHASPPYSNHHSPNGLPMSATPSLQPRPGSTAVSPIGPLPELEFRPNGRKRSWDLQSEEPPPKRLATRTATYGNLPTHSANTSHVVTPAAALSLPRLQLPNLVTNVSQAIPPVTTNYTPTHPAPQLPLPSISSGRAMSLVYPPATTGWSQAPIIPPPVNAQLSAHTPLGQQYDSRSRHHSPYPTSAGSSPTNANYPHNTQSPSYFLAQRSSPYRPVRTFNQLLVPPPSASLQGPPPNVGFEHMQYRPLGKDTERRAGVLPYLHHEAWPESHQYNQWPTLPQPNFHV